MNYAEGKGREIAEVQTVSNVFSFFLPTPALHVYLWAQEFLWSLE